MKGMRPIGAHVGASGGLMRALQRAQESGCDCIQLFSGAPMRWSAPLHDKEETNRFRMEAERLGIRPVFVHAPYLINLVSGDSQTRARSHKALNEELVFADAIGSSGVILHMGSSSSPERVEDLVSAVNDVLSSFGGKAKLILENSAGSGQTLGGAVEELGRVAGLLGKHAWFCIDTAHAYGAGYPIDTSQGRTEFIAAVDRLVGWDKVPLIHANDSRAPLGAKVDRHANIGKGHIGASGIRDVLLHPKLMEIPVILEVPGEEKKGPGRNDVMGLKDLLSVPLDKKR